jgi:tRNA(fMet)-specific endonuclease VapC
MIEFMLDTNALSEIVRDPDSVVARRLEREAGRVGISVIVSAEAQFGARKRNWGSLAQDLAVVMAGLDILPFEPPADAIYADLRAHLERAGTPIGANDMLIAAHALALGATLVTANAREFARVPGLAVEDWRA